MNAIAGGTKIQWCDETFSPWWGCEKVSPGCAHCYAEGIAKHRVGAHIWGPGHGYRWMSESTWKQPLMWARRSAREGRSRYGGEPGERIRVFCASMADVFEDRPELVEPRKRLFALIEQTPELDWLLLTKRPDRIAALSPYGGSGDWPQNVWLGTSVENSRFTWRAHHIREFTQVAVRFISAEPLLGSLYDGPAPLPSFAESRQQLDLGGIDWVIVGGESGPKARPFHLEHARELVDACEGHSAIFVKQLGAKPVGWTDVAVGEYEERPLKLRDSKGGDITEWPADLRIREFPRSAT